MSSYNAPFEIHVHGQVQLRADASFEQIQEALKPLWKYAGARSLADGAASAYEEEPGIKYDSQEHLLQMCWTVRGDEDFRQSLDEMCMSLNELSELGAAIEVTFYDADFDEEDEGEEGAESRDDFLMLFVGPTPAAIMQVQRDLLVQDVVNMMERHFDGSELGGVVAEIDKLFGDARGGHAFAEGDCLLADGLCHFTRYFRIAAVAGNRGAIVGHDHASAFGRQSFGDGPADTAARAGDDCCASVEKARHSSAPVFLLALAISAAV